MHGSARAARSLLTVLARRPRTALHTRSVDGRTGLVVRHDHRLAHGPQPSTESSAGETV
ncbi:hypothetical protein [Streptomyces griseomycini]|uniref:Uncharacterized protein n=1 Tax=Streptomyces griseomycini TaxID=66895 RepID=A0A7W7LZ95_9ACTN|nr:hypothetical protein [Streptomyces griseomycini]MBB4899082.1 hypothetical protein [Streptomyces griseomycini]GGQ06137.1 hypothetical protein GCM10010266_31980 [Streptomyces griseomycini]GGR21444.1 hypothetical protein GCM10015536_28920 [Streptomyces griseomycini]